MPLPAQQPLPFVSMLLIAYRQRETIGEAIAGALAQTYSPLEIIISDDASDDGTWEAMNHAVRGYAGAHRVRLNRNAQNLGIGAHLSHLAGVAGGELLVVAAGDDVSLPERCERIVKAWLDHGRRPDVIASALVDIDAGGRRHGLLEPSNLAHWRSIDDWLRQRPHVIGAAQAWTRRLVERFEPLPPGVVAEDLIMVFRAIASGGAITLDEPLVAYRRGGLSRRMRPMDARAAGERLLRSSRHALIELPQLIADARVVGAEVRVAALLAPQLARERYVSEIFEASSNSKRWRLFLDAAGKVPIATRVRIGVYAACPWLLAPWFLLKRTFKRS